MLIAHLKAHLVTGETVELLPVRHETDVKKELTGLLEGWHSSGFLIWEKFVYPWHQECLTCTEPIARGCMRNSGRVHARRKGGKSGCNEITGALHLARPGKGTAGPSTTLRSGRDDTSLR
jgi:hypothetical protein